MAFALPAVYRLIRLGDTMYVPVYLHKYVTWDGKYHFKWDGESRVYTAPPPHEDLDLHTICALDCRTFEQAIDLLKCEIPFKGRVFFGSTKVRVNNDTLGNYLHLQYGTNPTFVSQETYIIAKHYEKELLAFASF